MPDASVELRVYCICGQKMKVTEDMFGLPAKCVACRRKIRIPAREDIDPDVHEIHLKDHPELFRKAKKQRKTALSLAGKPVKPEAKAPDKAVAPVCAAEHAKRVPELLRPLPLDTLDALQEIVSLRNKVLRELRKFKENGQDEVKEERARLKERLRQVDEARSYLDNEIRQKRAEVEGELSAVREKIVQTGLLARLEEINFSTYRSMTERLRRRRDSLERLHYDLGAWLDIRDPRAAGGYVSRPIDQIPEPDFEIRWPKMPEDPAPLLEQHTQGLREGFAARERAKDKLEETARLRAEGAASPASVAGVRAEAKVEKRKAEAEITYRRKRLEESGQDTANDAQTIQACLERARKRLEEGALEKPAFETLEQELLRAKRDCAKAHDVVSRALIAGNSREVPDSKGSFLDRISGAESSSPEPPRRRRDLSAVLAYGEKGLGLDSWIAWAGALMLALSVFLPVVGKLSPLATCKTLAVQSPSIYWVMAAPILSAAAIVAAGAIPRRLLRGFLLLGLWLLLTVLAVAILHESRYSASAAAERFHKGGNWLMRPGVVLMVLANLTLLAAACTALSVKRRYWFAVGAAAVIAVAAGAAVQSDLMGYAVPMPSLSLESSPIEDAANPVSEVRVVVTNNGRRSLFLSPVQSSARNAFVYQVQKQVGPGAWSDVGIGRVQLTGLDLSSVSKDAPSHFRTLTLKPGAAANFQYRLPPGEYRVQLIDVTGAREPMMSRLTIAAPEPPPPPVEPVATEEPAAEESEVLVEEEPAATVSPLSAEAEVKGIIVGPDNQPRFSVLLEVPGKNPENIDAILGDKLFGNWVISEYNPARQTVTVTNGAAVEIIARGRKTTLGPS